MENNDSVAIAALNDIEKLREMFMPKCNGGVYAPVGWLPLDPKVVDAMFDVLIGRLVVLIEIESRFDNLVEGLSECFEKAESGNASS